MKTRDRIIHEARKLYNQKGYANVSSATLAKHLGIAEGNLWYHFNTKEAILTAISQKFAIDIESRLAHLPSTNAEIVDEYIAVLRLLISEFQKYRFLYRDQSDYGGHEIIRQNAGRWMQRTYEQFETYLKEFVSSGLLEWPEERLFDLAINATIILRYGLEHYREIGSPIEEGGGAIRQTLLRHLTLFEHRLMPEAAIRLRKSLDIIDDLQAETIDLLELVDSR